MKKIQCAIALGSNLGNSLNILENTIQILEQLSEVYLKSYSHWYETIPIGPPQPNYLNGCAILETYLVPNKLLETLFNIEQQWGRAHQERWGPRTLDLDLLLYGDLILKTDTLQIPHPRMTQRGFVLIPLAEIAPNWVHPVSKKEIIELLDEVDCSGVSLYQPN
ncbi:MAG: 2-amino-4-hydroxy-6-hydroxymethyldihydropteridine diphosphokinase [cyanobacterium endosymbiont of Rhopalodia musculus]|uniref:2-amino-4-hydroxy-6- hydroxymethyldihydropteridine diphosphokinase n=1 Tax=cyanobacterium endosymbiont of Epithemia clementina EcSB TaxID=3034674 RepID=UPI0024803A80|nr:2-amino-4-hydroxy-6-hydroxymethyldihydropteridine diphosphokinase [cyanobacterium endosymbiont of Epithemia clementina EcSB]WGT66796.1 2-amino-4-hydroxy-6-hydroxymethyldihydropteridine diphosphokinase [cyanobacterium endosymbiont of Epithemia clementina EcSB]